MNLRLPIALVAMVAMSACVSLLPEPSPPPNIYTLRAGVVEKAAGEPRPVVISISDPSAPRSVAGSDIVWRRDATIAFMERAAWDGAAPDLLRDLLIDEMSRRGVVRAVVRSGGGVHADSEVRWDVLSFEVVEEGSKLEAVIIVSAQLVDVHTRTIVAGERFDAHAPISTRSGRAAAAAMELAARDATLRIADWAAEKAQPSAESTRR